MIIGGNGQLGKELALSFSGSHEVISFSKVECDIGNEKKLENLIKKNLPDVIFNAAAYTDVESAEDDYDAANKINNLALKNLSFLAKKYKSILVHFSTDYIFNSNDESLISENDKANPINVYGKTKYLGEKQIISNCEEYFIFRISWVYGKYGNNFPLKIINLAKNNKELKVISDQYGVPTSTKFIANSCTKIFSKGIRKSDFGIYNLVPNGKVSWYEVAQVIQRKLNSINSNFALKKVLPVKSSEFITKANRPSFSVLSNEKVRKTFKIKTYNWDYYFDEFFEEIKCNLEKV